MGTIVFETYGGTEIPDFVNEAGLEAIAPEDPIKEGYIFDGWYADEAFTIPFIFDTVAEGTAYAYAKWIDNYTVTINGVIYQVESTQAWISGYTLDLPASLVLEDNLSFNSSLFSLKAAYIGDFDAIIS